MLDEGEVLVVEPEPKRACGSEQPMWLVEVQNYSLWKGAFEAMESNKDVIVNVQVTADNLSMVTQGITDYTQLVLNREFFSAFSAPSETQSYHIRLDTLMLMVKTCESLKADLLKIWGTHEGHVLWSCQGNVSSHGELSCTDDQIIRVDLSTVEYATKVSLNAKDLISVVGAVKKAKKELIRMEYTAGALYLDLMVPDSHNYRMKVTPLNLDGESIKAEYTFKHWERLCKVLHVEQLQLWWMPQTHVNVMVPLGEGSQMNIIVAEQVEN